MCAIPTRDFIYFQKLRLKLPPADHEADFFYDEVTQTFFSTRISPGSTAIVAKNIHCNDLFKISIAGVDSIRSIRLCSTQTLRILLQKEDYSVEVLFVFNDQVIQRRRLSSANVRFKVRSFHWVSKKLLYLVTSKTVELYSLSKRNLRMLDSISISSEWDAFEPTTSFLVLGRKLKVLSLIFDGKDSIKLSNQFKMDLSIGLKSGWKSDSLNTASDVLSNGVITSDQSLKSNLSKQLQNKEFASYNKRLVSIYNKIFLMVHSFISNIIYLFLIPYPGERPHKELGFNATNLTSGILELYPLVKATFCIELDSYNISSVEGCRIEEIDHLLLVIEPSAPRILIFDLAAKMEATNFPISCDKSEIEDIVLTKFNHFDETFFNSYNDILFLFPNVVLNFRTGNIFRMDLNMSLLIRLTEDKLLTVMRFLQNRMLGRDILLDLLYNVIAVKHVPLTEVVHVLDEIVKCNIATGLVNGSQVNSRRSEKTFSIFSHTSVNNWRFHQADIHLAVILPMLNDSSIQTHNQRKSVLKYVEDIIFAFICTLKHNKLAPETFLFDTLIDLMVKSSKIYQLKWLYYSNFIPGEIEIAELIYKYARNFPDLFDIALEIFSKQSISRYFDILISSGLILQNMRSIVSDKANLEFMIQNKAEIHKRVQPYEATHPKLYRMFERYIEQLLEFK